MSCDPFIVQSELHHFLQAQSHCRRGFPQFTAVICRMQSVDLADEPCCRSAGRSCECRNRHAGCFSALASTGILRRRLPVAAKIALAMAGTIADVPLSPKPPGGSALLTMWTSIGGASFKRKI